MEATHPSTRKDDEARAKTECDDFMPEYDRLPYIDESDIVDTDALLEVFKQIRDEMTTPSKIAPEDSSSFHTPSSGTFYAFHDTETIAKMTKRLNKDIAFIMKETHCTKKEAIFALAKKNGDVVNAVLYLSLERRECNGDNTPIIPETFASEKEAQVELVRALDIWKDRHDASAMFSLTKFNVEGTSAVDVIRSLYALKGVNDVMFRFFAKLMDESLKRVNKELMVCLKNSSAADTTTEERPRFEISTKTVKLIAERTGCKYYEVVNALVKSKNNVEVATAQLIIDRYGETRPTFLSEMIDAIAGGYDFEIPIKNVVLVMEQADCTFESAVNGLRKNKNDLVNAIIQLTII